MPKDRPNVLWLMTDEQRTDSLGCYGSPWARTPNLDRLAQEGVLFRHAVTPAPVCVPARVSLLTGQYPCETGVWYNHGTAAEVPFLTDEFRRAGYATASFGKQHYCTTNRAFETERQLVLSEAVHYFHYAEPYAHEEFGVVRYPESGRFPWIFGGRFPEAPERTTECQAVDAGIEWLSSLSEGRPFFLRVSFNGPHTPVAPPAPFDTAIDPSAITLPVEADPLPDDAPEWVRDGIHPKAGAFRLSRDEVREMRRYYYGEVAFLDQQFGRLLSWLRAKDELERTIVVFVSDHGTHLGDYGLVQKQTFYEPVVNVPFMFRLPGAAARGVRTDVPVETRQLLPTLMELCDLDGAERWRACSLGETVKTGRAPPQRPVFSELSIGSFGVRHQDRLAMVRDGVWKLSLCADPRPCEVQLHNLAADPWERTNLAESPVCRETRKRLQEMLLAHLHTPPATRPRPA